MSGNASLLAGTALGGALAAGPGPQLVYAFDALSFAVSFVLLARLGPLLPAQAGEPGPLRPAPGGELDPLLPATAGRPGPAGGRGTPPGTRPARGGGGPELRPAAP